MLVELEKIKNEFISSIEKIKKYIDAFQEVNDIDVSFMKHSKFYREVKDQTDKIKSNFLELKTVRYNAIIVSLYGSFELTIKKATKALIHHIILHNIGDVKKIKKENLSSVMRALERASNEEIGTLIEGLDLLFNKDDMKGYNYELSLNSFQNLKVDVVHRVAQLVGINNMLQQVKALPIVIRHIQEEKNLSDYAAAQEYINRNEIIFNEINDLVDSRNKIAHEGYEPNMWSDDIVKNTIIPKLTLFVSSYIYILQLEVLKLYYESGQHFSKIELLAPVARKNVICFNTKNFTIDKKSILLIFNSESKALWAKIVNIRENEIDVESSGENQNISCELNVNVKDSYRFYLFLDDVK